MFDDDGPRPNNGFAFDGADDAAVAGCVDRALDAWWMDRNGFEALRTAGMEGDVSWEGSARTYLEDVYVGGKDG